MTTASDRVNRFLDRWAEEFPGAERLVSIAGSGFCDPNADLTVTDIRMLLGQQVENMGMVERGSVVLWHTGTVAPSDVAARAVVAALQRKVGHGDFVLLWASHGDTVEMFSAESMAAAGWFRKPF